MIRGRVILLQYDWLAPWPFLVAGLSLPRGLSLLRSLCAWIRHQDGRVGG